MINQVPPSEIRDYKEGFVETWNYKEGFVVKKENGEILIVRDEVADLKGPLSEILKESQPNAIWLLVSEANYNAISIGSQVSINIFNGAIDESYPAQAQGNVTKKQIR